jgi:hypothetical protein
MNHKKKYQELKRAGKFSGTIKAALIKRDSREAHYSPDQDDGKVFHGRIAGLAFCRRACRSVPVTVPLGKAGKSVLARFQAANPRLREWSLGTEATGEASHMKSVGDNSDWRKKSTFRRGVAVQSVATCTDFRVAVFIFDGATHNIVAPRGWRWDRDTNGLRLRSCSDKTVDYHPTASELLGDVKEIAREARKNAATRKAAAKAVKADAAAVKRAEEFGVYVCLADSIRAGNCRAGSEAFGRSHGFDASKHYAPVELLASANGQTRFVALACTAALRRTIREINQGYSVIAEHQVKS